MFDGVPEELTNWLRQFPEDLRDSQIRYTVAASLVVLGFLGRNTFDEDCDPFMRWGNDLRSQLRVSQVGEALFLLRNQPGFGEIIRRLSTRDMRAAFYETMAARIFVLQGFSVHASPEINEKGSDFDFKAVRDGEAVNVEITGLTGAAFTKANILNALRKKRGQLPKDAPAIIGCFFPQAWNMPGIADQLRATSDEFLRGTGRVNYLGFMQEQFHQKGEGGMVLLGGMWRRNPKARRPSAILDLALSQRLPHEEEMRKAVAAPAVTQSRGYTEFTEWVDWALDG